jgi:transcriptional regulator of acetoin/glycerol metabolism
MTDRFLLSYLKSRRLEGRPGVSSLPTLDDLVREYIRYVLALTHHNIALSARILRVSRTTLYTRIRRDSP